MLLRKIKGTDIYIYPIGEMVKGEWNNGSGLEQWFSKCGPTTNSSSITWELNRNANTRSLPQTYIVRNSGEGTQQSVVQQLSKMILMHIPG